MSAAIKVYPKDQAPPVVTPQALKEEFKKDQLAYTALAVSLVVSGIAFVQVRRYQRKAAKFEREIEELILIQNEHISGVEKDVRKACETNHADIAALAKGVIEVMGDDPSFQP